MSDDAIPPEFAKFFSSDQIEEIRKMLKGFKPLGDNMPISPENKEILTDAIRKGEGK